MPQQLACSVACELFKDKRRVGQKIVVDIPDIRAWPMKYLLTETFRLNPRNWPFDPSLESIQRVIVNDAQVHPLTDANLKDCGITQSADNTLKIIVVPKVKILAIFFVIMLLLLMLF